jgi:CheY-like chemotaxis protein
MPRLLIVEDEPDIQLMVRLGLRSAGHQCIAVETGEAAIAILRAEPIDAMLLDIRLPGIDGWEVLSMVRADETLRDTKVIIMSAHGSPVNLLRAKDLGCDAYLSKPFTIDQLREVVEEALSA